jgi:hypothetical protein
MKVSILYVIKLELIPAITGLSIMSCEIGQIKAITWSDKNIYESIDIVCKLNE